jgi:hypothetical protein
MRKTPYDQLFGLTSPAVLSVTFPFSLCHDVCGPLGFTLQSPRGPTREVLWIKVEGVKTIV